MVTFLIINGVVLVLMLVALVWVRAVERRQKAAKEAAAAARGATRTTPPAAAAQEAAQAAAEPAVPMSSTEGEDEKP
jgi:flagellar biosynthesis/type III secretory pathway M-ring protein FliF/YscJ